MYTYILNIFRWLELISELINKLCKQKPSCSCTPYYSFLNMYSQTILCIQIKNLNAESVQGHHCLSVTVSLKFDERATLMKMH